MTTVIPRKRLILKRGKKKGGNHEKKGKVRDKHRVHGGKPAPEKKNHYLQDERYRNKKKKHNDPSGGFKGGGKLKT